MAPPTPSPRSTPTTPHHHSKATPTTPHHHSKATPTPHHSKHRLHFPSPNPKAPAATDHPVEVIGLIRNLPADLRKDEDGPAACSVLEISGDGRSLRVRADVGYRDFTLDGVSMSEHEDLEAFYRRFVASRVEGVRLGAKCTIIMYGPTGSGKSHATFGCPKQPGIVYRALRDILGEGSDGSDGSSTGAAAAAAAAASANDDEDGGFGPGLFVHVAVLEIYNEEIYDLLSGASNGGAGHTVGLPKGNSTPKVRLEVLGKRAKNASYISGNEAGKIAREVAKVEKRRIVKSTLCNERSSRSHCMIILDVPSVGGRLMLVDMAGSENIEAAGQTGLEAKMQTAKINQGNIALKRVVESIANGDSHVPFRDSKLTMLLQDSFEDDKSKILMILCASPDPKETHKTISTLEYGAKAKCIIRVTRMPTPKEKVDPEESSLLLKSRIVAMNQVMYKLQMENKLKEKECDDARKELLQKDAELAKLGARLQLIEERESEVKEAEINLTVDERTKTLKLELMKVEEIMLQQEAELTMLKQRLEEVELGRGKTGEDTLHDMDGGRFMKRLETYAGEPGMVKSMDLDMGDQQDSYDVKEIREDSYRHASYPKQSPLDACLSDFEEGADSSVLRFPEKVSLSTVFEGDEEDIESTEDEVDKEVVEENMSHARGIGCSMPFEDSGLNDDHDGCGSDSKKKQVGAETNSIKNTIDAISARRRTCVQNIFRLCGNHRELSQQVKVSSPLKRGNQDENRRPSSLMLGEEYESKLGLRLEQSQLAPQGKLLSESIVTESAVSTLLVTFASLELGDEQKSADQRLKRCVSSEPSKDLMETCSPGKVDADDIVNIYVKWEASKEISGSLIRKLKVLRDSTLADLRKLIDINLEEDNKKFTFLLLGDPSGAPVAKEKEARTRVNKLPICNNQLNGRLACLRPVKKAVQKPDHVPFGSLENTLPLGLNSPPTQVVLPKHANTALEYGSRISRSFGWSSVDNGEVGESKESILGQEGGEDGLVPKSFPVCDDRHSELIPCLDRNLIYQTRLKLDLALMEHYERHCPQPERRYNCLIPPPPGYKVPMKWPKSRDEVWQVNIPHTHLAHEKSDQNWMVVKGDKIVFPGGGTHFHYGADKYIAHLANMLNFTNNNLNNEGRIRTVFDVGCGVASFGGYLLSSDIISMSLAPNDVHQNQIQFALERGIPAYLGVLGTKRLPYPSRSFEFAHCSRCRIDWLQRDGILLLELDRLLRPGGYFAYSSPEAYAQDEEDLRIWKEISALVERMCWKIAAKKNQTVIWVKPLTNDCYLKREPGTRPPLCRSDDDPDAVWGVPMEACITPYSEQNQRDEGSGLAPWPSRLTTPPPRLADFGISTDMFEKDMEIWRLRVDNYWSLLGTKIRPNTLRNVMDMKANMGSFAAALKDEPVWVMNVVPEDGPNTLKIIYDRGLIGSVHDWCEAFSTYPRTYDLLHAWTVFSDIEKKGCSAQDLLIEMDRILRPTGFMIVRDRKPVIDFIKRHLAALHWESVAVEDAEPNSDSEDGEMVFVIQKKMWLIEESGKDSA
ncbi:unnamed protein product [Musa acuminata var. zebrina]